MAQTQLISCRKCNQPLVTLNCSSGDYKDITTRDIKVLTKEGKWQDKNEGKAIGKLKAKQSAIVCGKCNTSNNM